MINQTKAVKIVNLYEYVCLKFEEGLKYTCERFSNNNQPKFTDQEIITIYLFSIYEEQKFKLKHIHSFAKDYLGDWFSKLGSYVAFTKRLNRLSEVLKHLCTSLITEFKPKECSDEFSVLDSMPIITCSGKRKSKVAEELVDKTYNSTKKQWYYGIKLHALNFQNAGTLPHPESLVISKASESDLTIFKENWSHIENRTFFGDKIYHNAEYFESLWKQKNNIMYTPIKGVKAKSQELKQRDSAYETLYSKAVSTIRQPIESFFNWLNQKTQIQNASLVRSTNGLIVHIFGKIAACFLKPILNS